MIQELDALDQRIVAALQVDGRCSWRKMADVLGEPERNINRRASALLDSNVIAVSALPGNHPTALVRAQCAPGTVRIAATALANRPDCIFSYALTGGADCVAEFEVTSGDLSRLVLDELPATVGVARFWTDPILRYYRTVREWRPGILTEREAVGLSDGLPGLPPEQERSKMRPFSALDEKIVAALQVDGRVGFAELARLTGASEATARRRVDWLLRDGGVRLRVVVDPACLGLPTEAMLWVKVHPARVDHLARGLIASPWVRYAAALAGEFQFVANVTAPDEAALYRMVTTAPWVDDVTAIETDIVLQAAKRSGRLLG
ncbi:Lrp/AsnC family transcriptional regulator [Saxibacter everestensis]|uniref:Lrp/AsnC family transcriptional regulator n=1 Tax=Saxibacter everestensis TaxID=2909229 RepID=A0ABY8QRX8_9MICO|nr:Lrp/AsnC family transcriptional regulator [Brevibacteriaceae bacterium ZFBP1038]